MPLDLHLLNLASPVGFTEAAVAALRSSPGVHAVKGEPDADGRYRDLWLHVTKEFNEDAAEAARRS